MVVKSPTEVELPQHTALDGERLRMDDGQLVVAEVQRSEAPQARKCARLHLRDPGEEKRNISHYNHKNKGGFFHRRTVFGYTRNLSVINS